MTIFANVRLVKKVVWAFRNTLFEPDMIKEVGMGTLNISFGLSFLLLYPDRELWFLEGKRDNHFLVAHRR